MDWLTELAWYWW